VFGRNGDGPFVSDGNVLGFDAWLPSSPEPVHIRETCPQSLSQGRNRQAGQAARCWSALKLMHSGPTYIPFHFS
jgi:hypothetical protein